MMSSGVPVGAKMPCQESPITPLGSRSARNSVSVGTSGNAGIRSAPEVASALILPPLIDGIAVVEASRYMLTTPLITSGPGLVL